MHVDQNIQDERDAKSLYDVLQHEVIPLFYERDADDLPQKWISRMKRAVRTLGWRFNADRMVMDYVKPHVHSGGRRALLRDAREWAAKRDRVDPRRRVTSLSRRGS